MTAAERHSSPLQPLVSWLAGWLGKYLHSLFEPMSRCGSDSLLLTGSDIIQSGGSWASPQVRWHMCNQATLSLGSVGANFGPGPWGPKSRSRRRLPRALTRPTGV